MSNAAYCVALFIIIVMILLLVGLIAYGLLKCFDICCKSTSTDGRILPLNPD